MWTRKSKRRWHWPLPSFASDTGLLLSLYRGMVLTRAFDLKAVSLQRTGRLGTYATSLGQEAVSVGVASAMREEDAVFTSYRDNGTLLWRGLGEVQAGCD